MLLDRGEAKKDSLSTWTVSIHGSVSNLESRVSHSLSSSVPTVEIHDARLPTKIS
jgi:hypothetical protein